MEMLWSTSWTDVRVWTSVTVLLRYAFVFSESLTFAVCIKRCAEQQWGCSEDGEIEDPTSTTRQRTGHRKRGG